MSDLAELYGFRGFQKEDMSETKKYWPTASQPVVAEGFLHQQYDFGEHRSLDTGCDHISLAPCVNFA